MTQPFAGTPFDLTGRAALVTGGGVGIGSATAMALAKAGAIVGVHYHSSKAEAAETLAAIEKLGGRGVLLPGDLTDEAATNRVVDTFREFAGRIDILFNNAGNPLKRSTIENCPTDLWKQAFDVNVHSAFLVTRRAIPALKASGNGSIINNLSLSVQTGGSGGAGRMPRPRGTPGLHSHTRQGIGTSRASQRDHAGCRGDTASRSLYDCRKDGRLSPPDPLGTKLASRRDCANGVVPGE